MVSFPQVSPLKPCMRLSYTPYLLHVLPISVSLRRLITVRRKSRHRSLYPKPAEYTPRNDNYFSKISLNILPFTSRYSNRYLAFSVSNENHAWISLRSHACHMPHPSPVCCYFPPVTARIHLRTPFSNIITWQTKFHIHTKQAKFQFCTFQYFLHLSKISIYTSLL